MSRDKLSYVGLIRSFVYGPKISPSSITEKPFPSLDLITISLRLVSVSTGEVLIEVLVSKTITSAGISQDIFRFVDNNTRLIEVEGGSVENESTSIALQQAIEEGVLEIIKTGIIRGYWEYE